MHLSVKLQNNITLRITKNAVTPWRVQLRRPTSNSSKYSCHFNHFNISLSNAINSLAFMQVFYSEFMWTQTSLGNIYVLRTQIALSLRNWLNSKTPAYLSHFHHPQTWHIQHNKGDWQETAVTPADQQ